MDGFPKCSQAHVVKSFIESFHILMQSCLIDQRPQAFTVGSHPSSIPPDSATNEWMNDMGCKCWNPLGYLAIAKIMIYEVLVRLTFDYPNLIRSSTTKEEIYAKTEQIPNENFSLKL